VLVSEITNSMDKVRTTNDHHFFGVFDGLVDFRKVLDDLTRWNNTRGRMAGRRQCRARQWHKQRFFDHNCEKDDALPASDDAFITKEQFEPKPNHTIACQSVVHDMLGLVVM
jgi:hypothetical protein